MPVVDVVRIVRHRRSSRPATGLQRRRRQSQKRQLSGDEQSVRAVITRRDNQIRRWHRVIATTARLRTFKIDGVPDSKFDAPSVSSQYEHLPRFDPFDSTVRPGDCVFRSFMIVQRYTRADD